MVTHDRDEFAYAPSSARRGDQIVLSPDEAHHLIRVRRIGVGQSVMATDGEGWVYSCIVGVGGNLTIVETLPDFGEPNHPVFLCIAILKGDANRKIVDTATQLGVTDILFFHADRSEGNLESGKLEKLERVAVAAIKQTGRARAPHMSLCDDLENALDAIPLEHLRFFAHPCVEFTREWLGKVALGGAVLIVGPEGGFSNEEIAVAQRKSCYAVDLGRRRLRSETAVAAGLSFLSMLRKEIRA